MPEILDRFARVLRDRADLPLVFSFAERSWSAVDLDAWASHLAARCETLRVPAGSSIVTALGNRAEFIAVLLAGLRSGRPILPVDPGTTASGVLATARSFGARAIVGTSALVPGDSHVLPGGTRLAVTDDSDAHAYPGIAVLKLTSGSTGVPKAVLTTADNLARDVEQIVAAMDIGPEAVQLGTIPLSHAY